MKSILKKMFKNSHFKVVFSNLVYGKYLSLEDREYLLSCAQIVLTSDVIDKYGEEAINLAYYIILKYSIQYNDYQPLYDISINIGYYPISSYILNNSLMRETILDLIQTTILESYFSMNGHTVSKDQFQVQTAFLYSKADSDYSVIAPTSYGKSQMMLDHISKSSHNYIAIIVPTRSLLAQTYVSVRNLELRRKIIIHESMYADDEKFIAVMTQERALRFLDENPEIHFDSLYIDEAQNILNKGTRAILLSRLIIISKYKNKNCRIYYFSPTICDSNNLIINSKDSIKELRIKRNMKELSIFEYDGKYEIQYCPDYKTEAGRRNVSVNYLQYILQTSSDRNFIYLNSPKKVESFSRELYNTTLNVDDPELINVIENLSNNIHPGLKFINCLKKGILYLHGFIPDEVKEYLEEKYRKINSIRYLVANSVILEGINMPISSIYVLNTDRLNYPDLINLVGRANRLNYVFGSEGNISHLVSNIYFVKSEYARSNGTMSTTIKKLGQPKDYVNNPMLKKTTCTESETKKYRDLEQAVFKNPVDEFDAIKQKMVILGICYEFKPFSDEICHIIVNNIQKYRENHVVSEDIFDIIESIFLNNLKDVNCELSYLSNLKVRNLYNMYFEKRRYQSIKTNVSDDIKYFQKIKYEKEPLLYVSCKFGETTAPGGTSKSYVDISNKSFDDLVNYSLIRQKLESDFVSYHLLKFIRFLYEMKIIGEDEYNYYTYGSKEPAMLPYAKSGLSLSTINFLKDNNQLDNLYVDENNVIHGDHSFVTFYRSLDDYMQFTISRFIQLD